MKSEVKENDSILTIVLLMIGLFIPAFFQQVSFLGPNRQLIIGTIVNATLIACALKINDPKKIVALSVLPSISSMTTGLLFSGLTLYSKVMLPFIWIGNLALVFGIKYLSNKFAGISSFCLAILLKVGIIFGGFKLMSYIMNFPSKINTVFSTTFGITQLYTATYGLLLVLTILGIKRLRDE